MSGSPLNPGSEVGLVPAVHNALPAVQHGLLVAAVHPTGATVSVGQPAPTGFIIAVL